MIRTCQNRLRVTVKLALALAIGSSVVAPAVAETDIKVVMNQAKIIKLARAADTVVIGNPLIADAVVQDSKTIVLTGKGYGVTNLVIIDADGGAIVDEQVIVSASDTNSLRVYRQANMNVFSCTPYCQPEFRDPTINQ